MTLNMEIMVMELTIKEHTEWLQQLRRDGRDWEASKVEEGIAELRQRLAEFITARGYDDVEDDATETRRSA